MGEVPEWLVQRYKSKRPKKKQTKEEKDTKVHHQKEEKEEREKEIERLKQEQANEVAREKAQTLMSSFDDAQSRTEFVTKTKLGRFEQGINAAITGKAFQMAQPAGSAVVDTVALANGYAVIVLDKVNAAEGIDDNLLSALEQRLSAQYSEGDYRALIATLKAKGDVVYISAQ